MQLAKQGKFDIDAPIQTYAPNFGIKTRFGDAEPIAPRILMTHRSGLPSDIFKGFLTDASFFEQAESLQNRRAAVRRRDGRGHGERTRADRRAGERPRSVSGMAQTAVSLRTTVDSRGGRRSRLTRVDRHHGGRGD